MKKPWKNPVAHPAKQSTMQTEGDFANFAELMKRVVKVKPPREAKQISIASASPGPAVSS